MLRDGSHKRTCDLCGYNGLFRELTPVGQGKFHCRDDRENWTADQTRRHNRKRRPLVIKPRPHARITGEVPLYQMDEAEVFNLVLRYGLTASTIGPSGATVSAATASSLANCGLYLRELLLEDKRPLSWMAQGLTQLKAIGRALLAKQVGSPTGSLPSEATSSVRYGAVDDSGFIDPIVTAYAGLVFLALATKDPTSIDWLPAADRCAWFLRQVQRADLLTVGPVVDSGGNPVFVGGWPNDMDTTTKAVTAQFFTGAAVILWFLRKYATARGAATVLGTTTAAGDFSSAPSGTVQQTIDAALDFYATGRFPYNTSSTTKIAPLSATTPQRLFTPASASSFSNVSSGGYVGMTALNFVTGLRGLYECEGYTARVAAIFEWLMAFDSNATFEAADGTPLNVLFSGAKGTYDPAVGIANFLAFGTTQTQSPTLTTNGTSFYSTPGTAFLGPLYGASNRLMRTWKDGVVKKRPLNGNAVDNRLPLLGSTIGLSFQLSYGQTASYPLSTIAQNGLIFRAAPGAFNELRGVA